MSGDALPHAFPVHHDPRGRLLPIELDEVGFPVRRLFLVTGVKGGSERGNHLVPCRQEVVLVRGRVEFTTTDESGAQTTTQLDQPGQRLTLATGHHVRFVLDGEAEILVLAAEPFTPHPRLDRR